MVPEENKVQLDQDAEAPIGGEDNNESVVEKQSEKSGENAADQEQYQQPATQPVFSYSPLFEIHQYDKLKAIAKQVFVSPIYHWSLFSILKKRLEIAHEIR